MNSPTRLFNEYEALTEAGYALDNRVATLLGPIVTEYVRDGYSARDIGIIMNGAIDGIIATVVLRAATDRRKISRRDPSRKNSIPA